MDMKYARIIGILAERLHVTREEAMDTFYNSPLFELIDKGVADLHCRSDQYLADEIINDIRQNAPVRSGLSPVACGLGGPGR